MCQTHVELARHVSCYLSLTIALVTNKAKNRVHVQSVRELRLPGMKWFARWQSELGVGLECEPRRLDACSLNMCDPATSSFHSALWSWKITYYCSRKEIWICSEIWKAFGKKKDPKHFLLILLLCFFITLGPSWNIFHLGKRIDHFSFFIYTLVELSY